MTPPTTYTDKLAAGLRAWAHGMYPLEAAVELLIRVFDGRLLRRPWITPLEDGYARLVDDPLGQAGVLSGGEYRVLQVVASLVGLEHPVALYDALPGLDRDALDLVLAAMAHAAGSHEHSRIVPDPQGRWVGSDGIRLGVRRYEALHPWPGAAVEGREHDPEGDPA